MNPPLSSLASLASPEALTPPAANAAPRLVDPIGRTMRKLRVSLTDACQYRCFYCMPENATFTPREQLLTTAEYRGICGELVALGIEELRITGGEPTVRPEFRAIMSALAELPVRRFGLTSNGQLLEAHLEFLRDIECRHLNISLDSLDAGRFERITRGGDFRKVLAAIEKAKAMGFEVKVNAVMFRGVNDEEVVDFARWSASSGVEVRFLEYMKIGDYETGWKRFIAADEMIARLEETTTLYPVPVPGDSTSFVFETAEGGRLGFIASESKPFCGTCSRLRLSALGTLRSCLMSEQGLSLRGLPFDAYPALLGRVMAMKPTGRLEHVRQAMHEIGG